MEPDGLQVRWRLGNVETPPMNPDLDDRAGITLMWGVIWMFGLAMTLGAIAA